MRCPSCGRENPPEAGFCSWCGTSLRSVPPDDAVTEALPVGASASHTAITVPFRSATVGHRELHRGKVFALGESDDVYAVWHRKRPDRLTAWYEHTRPGWEQAWARFTELEGLARPPEWRSDGPGWILLHLFIGAVAFPAVQLVLIGFVLSAAGLDTEGLPIDAVLFVAGPVGWILFVYLRTTLTVRWAILLSVTLGGFLLALAVNLATQPPVRSP